MHSLCRAAPRTVIENPQYSSIYLHAGLGAGAAARVAAQPARWKRTTRNEADREANAVPAGWTARRGRPTPSSPPACSHQAGRPRTRASSLAPAPHGRLWRGYPVLLQCAHPPPPRRSPPPPGAAHTARQALTLRSWCIICGQLLKNPRGSEIHAPEWPLPWEKSVQWKHRHANAARP